MANHQDDMVWAQIGRIGTCMMVTHDAGAVRARPMVGTTDRDAHAIWFITNRKHHKDDEILSDPRVCLAYADQSRNTYVSVSGHGEVVRDETKLRELWNVAIDAWFDDGAEDPDAVLVKVTPQMAEYWDSPSSDVVVALKMLTASARNERPDLGENRKVDM